MAPTRILPASPVQSFVTIPRFDPINAECPACLLHACGYDARTMGDESAQTGGDQQADRRAKLDRLRDEFGVDPFGGRVDGLITLADARGRFDDAADAAVKESPDDDQRPVVKVAGRVVLHRDIGRLVFMTVRDGTGDLQLAVSKKAVGEATFKLAKLTDLGDIVVAAGPLGTTKTGEITIWTADRDETTGFAIATKSLTPPPEKWHGLQDSELRYRRRYVDLYVNPEVRQTFETRSRILKRIRDFLTDPPGDLGPGFLEVETPMMQPMAGGAAARPFVTHHNAMDMRLFLRIAPELYLKRLLVGGLHRVFEINRNFRNEGIDRAHNPEFTMLELYQAFGDYHAMMAISEQLIHTLAVEFTGSPIVPYGDEQIDCSLPFRRARYHELFAEHAGFESADTQRVADLAAEQDIATDGKDADLILRDVWEHVVEPHLVQPTFVMDYPAEMCPLTKPKAGDPTVAERVQLYFAHMELVNAYTELNDPDVQAANFSTQITGLNDEEQTFRATDDDFLEALRVGMPPAGGLGIGIDRLVMLLTNQRSIRDVILFPLMRPSDAEG